MKRIVLLSFLSLIVLFIFFSGQNVLADHDCNQSCGSPSYCNAGLSCIGASCTNASCPGYPGCVCPVNGSCSATHYNCNAGASANNVDGAATWTWGCNGYYGGSNADCSEPKPPTCSISANPASIGYYSSSTISWSSSNTTSCSVSPPGWTGTSGSQSTGSLTTTSTYTESCSGAGGSCNAQTIVLVGAPATPTLSCTAYTNPASIIWNWTTSSGPLSYWLQVWDDAWKANQWYSGPTVTTTATPGVPYYGHVLAGDGSQSSNWSTNVSCTVPAPSTPTGSYGSFNNSPTNPATPITLQWTSGTSIQVWDNTGYWWYNAAASSPLTFNTIPPGRTVYARTTYDFSYFSATANITAPLPSNPSPVTISGPLQQKSGIGCYPADATTTFTVQNPTTTTSPSSCVSTSCTVSPSNNAGQTYSCTTTFNSQACLNNNPPTWPISATVTLTGVPPAGYSFIGWTPNGSCTPPSNTKNVNAADTITNQPITFDFSGVNWMKLKSSSFNGVSVTSIAVPAYITNYDADDDGLKYFISGIGGTASNTTVQPNTEYSNPNNWFISSYSRTTGFNAALFLDYTRSRKQYTDLTTTGLSSDLHEITTPGIYYYKPSSAFTITADPVSNFVLIVDGNIDINKSSFNLTGAGDTPVKSIAILSTGTLSFNASTPTAKAGGIFVAGTVDTGTLSNQGLKIKGNFIGLVSSSGTRTWSDTSRPGLFVVFDSKQYIDLLPYLSIAKYDQTIQ